MIPARPRILFVDDEKMVLEGIANSLRRDRKRWELLFAEGGESALREMGKAPVDVIVSDMQMPGMDGLALLKRVMQESPATARLVLSGHAEPGAMMSVLSVAQQVLTKPCDAEVLRAALETACGRQLHGGVSETAAAVLVGSIRTLPAAPGVYLALTRALEDPRTTMPGVGNIIAQDPALSAHVLRIASSGYFSNGARMENIAQAVTRLGLELVRGLVVQESARTTLLRAPRPALSAAIARVQTEALLAARIARRIAPDRARADAAFTATLLHSVGRLVIASRVPDAFALVSRRAEAERRPVHEIEVEELGVTYGAIGARLLDAWGLSSAIVRAVEHQHSPSAAAKDDLALLVPLVVAVTFVAERKGDAPTEGTAAFLAAEAGADLLASWTEVANEEVTRG